MKVFLSTDMEGTAGIVDWEQCVGDGPEATAGRRLLLDEVNAAIDGALAGGATEIVVNDSHYLMRNLPPAQLHGRATYLAGRHKPLYMMQGLDESFDAVFYVSYHGSMGGDPAVLSHTYNPGAVMEVRLDGRVVGEAGINTLVAAHFGVPVVLITGDQTACEEARAVVPDVEAAVVKQSVSRFGAASLHPEVACELIRSAAERAVRRAAEPSTSPSTPPLTAPAALDVVWRTGDMAEMAEWIDGVERTGARTVRITAPDLLTLFRAFVTTLHMTRGISAHV